MKRLMNEGTIQEDDRFDPKDPGYWKEITHREKVSDLWNRRIDQGLSEEEKEELKLRIEALETLF